MLPEISRYPSLKALVEAQIQAWPQHSQFLEKSIGARSEQVLAVSEIGAELVLGIAATGGSGLAEICSDYRFVCETMILEEELYFRRHGRYRLASFAEAEAEYYSKPDLMRRYMHGLLLSGIFWLNHANALDFYVREFLPKNVAGYRHLEVGPGHGLLIQFAARDPRCAEATGWDVSPHSISSTKRALGAIGLADKVNLVCQDVMKADRQMKAFDSIVISEVLEHLEDPVPALESLFQCLKPGGRIWVNMPSNSPAPDHLYLLDQPEETMDLMRKVGFEIETHGMFPMTGYSLERARKLKLTINCAAIGRRPV
jgi:2-polyprenyl-3-methyl-5-hydroxy-6-metoxy-1,4-benzoquinol methylase